MNQLEESYLMHYGVKMKSGRYRYGTGNRPYQHTPYPTKKFKAAEREVRNNLSNDYGEFEVEPFNRKKAEQRAGSKILIDPYVSEEYFSAARKREPQITRDIINSVSKTSAKMYGLKNRIKQPTSLAGKIGSDANEKGIGLRDAANGIKDAVRYTAVSEDKDFVKNYKKIKRDLESKGYKETKCKNYFEQYRQGKVMHKAVQSNFANKNGYEFEVQFQTPASQAAKELKIPIYEERRKSGISKERALELEQQMRDLADHVSDPPGIETIRKKG